jgi:FkbM family methyltransferase
MNLILLKTILRLPTTLRNFVIGILRLGKHDPDFNYYNNAPLVLCRGISMTGLIPGDVISDSIATLGFFDWKKSLDICSEGRHNAGLLVDVGANIGYFSLLWLGLNKGNRVISVEASPRNISIIKENIKINNLDGRLNIFPVAASDHVGTVRFDVGPLEQTGWGGITTGSEMNTIELEAVTLDKLLVNEEVIELLKIDVEGAELLVLKGAEGLLKMKRIKKIWFETNLERMQLLGIDCNAPIQYLNDHGYECTRSLHDDAEWEASPAS